jgi:hypothetical protein
MNQVPITHLRWKPATNDTPTADEPVANDTPMAHKPITNDTLMVDMIETPGNKNSQDHILIQDNSAVRTYNSRRCVIGSWFSA